MELLSKVEAFPDIQTYRASWANLFEKQTAHDQNPQIAKYKRTIATEPINQRN